MSIWVIDVTNEERLFFTVQEEATKSGISGELPIPIPDSIGISCNKAVSILSAVKLL